MFSSCWSVYGLRKVLLGKEILILSSNSGVNKRILISGIRLTYKVVTPDIKRKQNNFFWNFWNIGLVLVTLINWLLKPKCVLIRILNFYFLYIYIYIWKYNMIYFWETWSYAWKQNILFYLFIYVLPKTGYFNTKLVSLQYKNTNRCWLKYRRKQKNHRFLKHFFYLFFIFFIWTGPIPTHVAGLDPATLLDLTSPSFPMHA